MSANWEYSTRVAPTVEQVAAILGAAGGNGWELVTVFEKGGGGAIAFLKRPIAPPKRKRNKAKR
ncbi:MAG: hypothetical protein HY290_10520 [Planctomycetia bacterium]|nr:hypothetical protein [Planctomycetia bacterium]